jgi:hypothetical protein
MNTAVIKPEGPEYKTSDQLMCEVLMMAGHNAVSVKPGDDGQLVYVFAVGPVWDTVEKILTGRANDMTFTYADWWRARITWQMNLRHLSQSRRR